MQTTKRRKLDEIRDKVTAVIGKLEQATISQVKAMSSELVQTDKEVQLAGIQARLDEEIAQTGPEG